MWTWMKGYGWQVVVLLFGIGVWVANVEGSINGLEKRATAIEEIRREVDSIRIELRFISRDVEELIRRPIPPITVVK